MDPSATHTLADLIAGIDGLQVDGDVQIEICQVTHDSRAIIQGGLYVALPGRYYDGARYAPDAIARGAAAILLAGDSPFAQNRAVDAPGVTILRTDAPRPVMAELAARVHGHPSRGLSLVGVTGTNGKTTTTSLLADMVACAGYAEGLIGTNGVRIAGSDRKAKLTTPESPDLQALLADMVAADVRVAAMEVSSVGVAEERCAALHFAAAGFLNLSVDHLDYHKTMAAYGQAKRRLFTELIGPDGVAIINVEDPFGAALAAGSDSVAGSPSADITATIWSLEIENPSADVHIRDLVVDAAGIAGTLVTPKGEVPFECPLVGRYNAVNAALAGALALAVGMPKGAIAGALQRAAIAGRMQALPNPHGFTVVVDYAHSDDAIDRVLAALRPLTVGRLWCVFGCGGDRDATKRGPMGRAAAAADVVIITNDNPRSEDPQAIAQAALAGAVAAGRPQAQAPTPGHCWVQLDRASAIAAAISGAARGDTVLIAGKGHEAWQEIAGVKHPFDDVAVARKALEAWA
ncbi:MAG: UDP-N-acetylmuramoyl-L-alanyl-D-glutamate--2,6-diaminopimelate ligase [Bradymonadia bacterium]|jgi:UDP-N-acetylmuramoyl-L-alanyl-D-glutamate--2,6-diaminopimelate ligase